MNFLKRQAQGSKPARSNPLAVEALREIGIDISENRTQSVFDISKSGELFAYTVTVCSEAEAKGCPLFPAVTERLHWPFSDPSKFTGSHQEKLAKTRELLEQIRAKIDAFCEERCLVDSVRRVVAHP